MAKFMNRLRDKLNVMRGRAEQKQRDADRRW